MSASTAPTPNGRSGRKIAGALTILALIAVGIFYVASALTDTTASNDNFFESGTLSITDDNTDSNALFEVENVQDNDVVEKCITVTNDGTIPYDALTITRSAGVGGLGDDVSIAVYKLRETTSGPGGPGVAVSTAGASCTAFDAAVDSGDFFAGDPALPEDYAGTAVTTVASGIDPLVDLQDPGDSVSYKIIASVQMENDDQGQDVNDIDFAWSASQG